MRGKVAKRLRKEAAKSDTPRQTYQLLKRRHTRHEEYDAGLQKKSVQSEHPEKG
jgi:hypothetical protein